MSNCRTSAKSSPSAIHYLGLVAVAIVLLVPSTSVLTSSPGAPGILTTATAPGHAATPNPLGGSSVTDSQDAWTNTSIPLPPQRNWTCGFSGLEICSPQQQSPSLLNLSNGQVGLVYSEVVNQSAPSCPGTASYLNNSTMDVFIAFSSDGGIKFHGEKPIGGNPDSYCPYFNAFEPTFTVSSNGTVEGAFILTTASLSNSAGNVSGLVDPPGGSQGVADYSYTSRWDTALAFTTSSTNGTTFSPTHLLVTGNISRPAIATFGQSVYLIYQNLSNTSAAAPVTVPNSDGSAPISLDLLYSANGGSTWSGPTIVPGGLSDADPAEQNTTGAGSIDVSATGELAVAYSANRTCVAYCNTQASYGDDVVVATSTSNGSQWNGPTIVAENQGEASPYSGVEDQAGGLFALSPDTSIKFGPTPGNLYLAWSASYNISINDSYDGGSFMLTTDWSRPDVFSSFSANNGTNWSVPVMVPPALRPQDPIQNLFGEGYFNPALGVSSTGVYLTYSYTTWMNYACGYLVDVGNAFTTSTIQYVSHSPDGKHWDPAGILDVSTSSGIDYFIDMGFTASIGFTASATPIIAYSLAIQFFGFIFTPTGGFILWNGAQIEIDTPYTGAKTTITLVENGVPAGTSWVGAVQGIGLDTNQSSVTLTGIPTGVPVYIQWPAVSLPSGPQGTEFAPVVSDGPQDTFSGPATIYFNFSTFYPVTIIPAGNGIPTNGFDMSDPGPNGSFTYNLYWYTYGPPPTTQFNGCPEPMYFPSGFHLSVGSDGPVVFTNSGEIIGVEYWTGAGNGSYTGPGPILNVTVDGPINETFWDTGAGVYTVDFRAPDLPSNSTYSFSVNGHQYSGTGGDSVPVPELGSGAYQVTNITATSLQAGWDYFGTVDSGNPVIIPSDPVVNLSFTYVEVGAAAGGVSFHVNGLSPGTIWHLSVNGTEYASSTSYINLTLKPSTVPYVASPVVLSSGAEELAPSPGVGLLNVTPGSTYNLTYIPQYHVTASASLGGNVSGGGSFWLSPGSSKAFVASAPQPGYVWGGWTGSGTGSYSGLDLTAQITANGPIQETASFEPLNPNRFDLQVNQTGIPDGTNWTVIVDGKGYTSENSSLVIPGVDSCEFSGPGLGTYTVLAQDAYSNASSAGIRYVPTTPTITECSEFGVHLQFTPEYYGILQVGVGGSASVTLGTEPTVALPADLWMPNGSLVSLTATPDAGYVFAAWAGTGSGSYTGALETAQFTASGAVTETAEFAVFSPPLAKTYSIQFTSQTPLEANSSWAVTVGPTTYSSTTSTLTVAGLLVGNYSVSLHAAMAPGGATQYLPLKFPSTLDVTENLTENVTFSVSYWISLSVVGPGSITPSSGWYGAGAMLSIAATAASGAFFESWQGAGTGGYSGTNAVASFTVQGPVTETASFAPSATSITTQTPVGTTTSFWDQPILWVGLAVVGLIAGVGLGYLLRRTRTASPPPATGSEDSGPDPSGPGPEEGEP
ncbi:MAG: hypothetical protein L3K03_08315 [Thermoplasmata archaeon]|nr:hypothetical protein [Thermoplasmata archaeon]